MTLSSSPIFERGLDTMLVVYSSLTKHPAATDCEQFIRSRTGWFTTSLSLLEAKAILTKVYGVDALPAKGLPRILHHFHRWLSRSHPQVADEFWSQTGNGSHMP
jgi:hypothetical protein